MAIRKSSARVAVLGVLGALAVIMGYVEYLIPVINTAIPGIRFGMANIVIVMVLYVFSYREALAVSVLRLIINALLFGNIFSILFSLSGTVLSLLVMCLLKKTGLFSMTGVSAAGGAFHNIGQILMAWAISGASSVLLYMPVLMTAGVLTGAFTGAAAYIVMRKLPWQEKDQL